MLLSFLKLFFKPSDNYTTRLEMYLKSKRPTSTAELEYWIREFDRKEGMYA